MKQPTTFSTLPTEIILTVFKDEIFADSDIVKLCLVCKYWNEIASDNAVWRLQFIQQFSYDPKSFHQNSFFKDSYRDQSKLMQILKETCKESHKCFGKEGLYEAIQAKNYPLIYALIKSNHKIFIDHFPPPTDTKFITSMLAFLLACSELPPLLFAHLLRRSFCNAAMEELEFIPFHFILAEANAPQLRQIFTSLDSYIFSLSRYCDFDDRNWFHFLVEGHSIDRVKCVLKVLHEVIGDEKMSSLLSYKNASNDWSCIHTSAIYGKDYFMLTFNYLIHKDYNILIQEGLNSFDVPICILAFNGEIEALSLILSKLGTEATHYLKYQNSQGKNILFFAVIGGEASTVKLLENTLGIDFYTLLLSLDTSGDNILEQVMQFASSMVHGRIEKVLTLLNEYNCLELSNDLFHSRKFDYIVENNPYLDKEVVISIFNKYNLTENQYTSCTLI